MIDRRQFSTLLALSGLAASVPAGAAPSSPAKSKKPTIKPRHLSPGDTVGMILPATQAFNPSAIDIGREQLEALGFKVKVGAHARDKVGSYAGTDSNRVADLHAMFADPEIAGVVCYAGGWGTPRLLPLLDFDLIRKNPKVFVGYSDITALLNAIHQETGLVTFHGPVAASNLHPYTIEHLKKAVMSTEAIGTLANPEKEDDELVNRTWRQRTIRSGRATGRLVGGNLTLVSSLMGTPWQVQTDGAILLLEDIQEAPYRIDRMLTQLALGGLFERVAGVIWGYCTDCESDGPSFSIEEILDDRFGKLGVPVLTGLAFGHIRKILTLPIGLDATLDTEKGTLEIAEAAVV